VCVFSQCRFIKPKWLHIIPARVQILPPNVTPATPADKWQLWRGDASHGSHAHCWCRIPLLLIAFLTIFNCENLSRLWWCKTSRSRSLPSFCYSYNGEQLWNNIYDNERHSSSTSSLSFDALIATKIWDIYEDDLPIIEIVDKWHL